MKITFLFTLLTLSLLGCSHPSVAPLKSDKPKAPDHFVFMLFDQMRPDYVDRYDLKNFKRLRTLSAEYVNAYLGYMGSETVVSHAVIPAGVPPSKLPWSEDVYWDRKGILGKADEFHYTGGLKLEQYEKLLAPVQSLFLPELLKQKLGKKIYSIGEKNYAALILGARGADHIVTLAKDKEKGICYPVGRSVPTEILANPRFTVECKNKYGTEKLLNSLDGSRFVPGSDLAKQGGDVWTADVAIELMKKEDWSSMFLTFGGIDKVSHLVGGHEGERPASTKEVQTPYDIPEMLKIADTQLGRILLELEKRELLQSTVIVLTSDHGGQTDQVFLGDGKSGWYGSNATMSNYDVNEVVKSFTTDKAVRVTLQNTAVRVWTKPGVSTDTLVSKLKKIPGAIELVRKSKDSQSYQSIWKNFKSLNASQVMWAKEKHPLILKNSVSETSADFFVFLNDDYGFDAIGDHGGAQEKVQRVPFYLYSPFKPASQQSEWTTHDTIKEKVMGLFE